jgi:hypothetical protein
MRVALLTPGWNPPLEEFQSRECSTWNMPLADADF